MRAITEIREIQEKLNTILWHLADVCEKHGLRFYLSNGTLLGAVKYQGFIPWDDDVDVLMPREDYDALMRLEEIDSDRFRLLSAERQSAWKLPFAKLCDCRTVVQETTADFGCEIGLFIDIFPLDCWKNRRCCARQEAKASGFWRRCMSASLETSFYSPRKGVKRAVLYAIWCYSRLCGVEHFRKRVVRLSRKHAEEPSQYIGCVVWSAYGTREVLPRELFEQTREVVFEGRTYTVFAGFDAYLRQLYGAYENDPPAEKQKTHHTFAVFEKELQEA